MKRNLLSFCLICVMLFSLCSGITISAQAGPIELPMIPGNPTPSVPTGLKYQISNGQVTITSYIGSNTNLNIPNKIQNYPVTTIGDSAFQGCDKLTQITLPNTITSIGSNAFGWCEKLVSVNIPNGVTQIGNNAFNHCYSLSSISIPSSVVDIGSSLFYECDTLVGIWVDDNNPSYSSDEYGVLFNKDKSILLRAPSAISGSYVIPSTVTTISEYAFANCNGLNEIIFQGNAPALGDVCFRFVTATVYYPNGDSTWTDDVMKQYEGNITWMPMDDTVSGDIDGDMTVDNKDVEFLLWYTLFPEDYPLPQNADFNGDSAVDNQDVEYLLWHTLFPEDYPLS